MAPNRNGSNAAGSASHDHRPANPSQLRQTFTAPSASNSGPGTTLRGDGSSAGNDAGSGSALIPSESSVLGELDSPRTASPDLSFSSDHDALYLSESDGEFVSDDSPVTRTVMRSRRLSRADWKKRIARRVRSRKMNASRDLAHDAGFKNTTSMYLSYYVQCLRWMGRYKVAYLKGDFVAAITVASFYIPMSLSMAENLAHIPPINGLYSFAFTPLIYAILGTCPQMVVGPVAACSLLLGSVVRGGIDHNGSGDLDGVLQARICGVVTGMSGAIILGSGLARLGFMDSVLSRPFLRGFVSAIGFVIFVEQLIPEMGLSKLAASSPANHGSSIDKIVFIAENAQHIHWLTFTISAVSFTISITCRELKRRLQPRYPSVAYIPDLFLVVVLSAVLCWALEWDKQGVAILGQIKSSSGGLFAFRWPFRASQMKYIRDAMSTAFLISLLGFFESSVAAKTLGASKAFPAMQVSPNRELVALGVSNLVAGMFMSLPAFGGYGRSKVSKATGSQSPVTSIFLSLITFLCIFFLLPYFYYLPKPVLATMISVVALSLIEEAPHDILFFLRIHGWTELLLMAVIFLSTIFYSLTMGIAIGVGLSLLQVIRHSTRPRIQILGRIPDTDMFESAENNPDLEFIDGCLFVKIPEPLTFANTGSLKSRLRRLELYGTNAAHPALPRLRNEALNQNIIFDIHGVTSMDGSGCQVLEEIVRDYRSRGVRIIFCRVPTNPRHSVRKSLVRAGIVDMIGGESHLVNSAQEALRLTEHEDSIEPGVIEGGLERQDISTEQPASERTPLLRGDGI